MRINRMILQPTPVNSYPDNSDLRLIRMHLRPPFRDDQCSNIIRLFRISHYSYYFIRSLAIRISRIPLYFECSEMDVSDVYELNEDTNHPDTN